MTGIDRVADDFFIGTEVENSPAKSMRTLFVVGLQSVDQILELARSNHCEHVYLGANMSMHYIKCTDNDEWTKWDRLIEDLTNDTQLRGITIDITNNQLNGFLESSASENNKVIPMVSVKLPYTKLLNYNTTIKLDDTGFDETNPGVWCHSLHDLMDREHFTPWIAYKGDIPATIKKRKLK